MFSFDVVTAALSAKSTPIRTTARLCQTFSKKMCHWLDDGFSNYFIYCARRVYGAVAVAGQLRCCSLGRSTVFMENGRW